MLSGTLHIIGLGFGLAIVYGIGQVLYNIFLHPLRNFPGPFLMRATRMAYCYKLAMGTLPFDLLHLHNKYGDVIRIAPDELALANDGAWKEIMGHRIRGSQTREFEKFVQFYKPLGGPTDIVNSAGPEHAMLRRLLSHGFSDRSLKEQEPLIMKYVDLFIEKLHGNCQDPVDLTSWYNYTTFDVIGDLVFGEPFGCLGSSDYHPWVKIIFQMARFGCVMQVASYFPLLRQVIIRLLSSESIRNRKQEHQSLTKNKLLRRMKLGASGGRPDLIEGLIRKKDEMEMPIDNLLKNASILIIGGSETTATLLSGVTYVLLRNPQALDKLTEEVRSTFKAEDEINLTSVNQLTYMIACLNEALRVYPPIPGGLPRVCPKGGATVSGQFIPENTIVAIHQWAMYHNAKYFKDPFDFRPSRFMGDPEYAQDSSEALQPFHVGPRNCLGRNLAYVEMRVILARLIWNFDLILEPESNNWLDKQKVYILWDKGPLMVKLKPVVRNSCRARINSIENTRDSHSGSGYSPYLAQHVTPYFLFPAPLNQANDELAERHNFIQETAVKSDRYKAGLRYCLFTPQRPSTQLLNPLRLLQLHLLTIQRLVTSAGTICLEDLHDQFRPPDLIDIMAMGGDGPWAVAVMWALTALVLFFVVLRIHARATIIKSYGIDDHVYFVAFVFLLLFTVFINVSAMYGFGQNMSDIPSTRDKMKAVLFECISQTFNVLGMALAKWSLGLFLLRIVPHTWQKLAIWTAMLLLMGATLSCLFCFWFQCSPPAFLWDRTIPGGRCEVDQLPVSIILGTACVVVDFFFAIFPWIVLWNLQMNQREKYVILGSLSLGIIAGICGIKRATEIPTLLSQNYLRIPICRPLYKRYIGKWSSKGSSKNKGNSQKGFQLQGFTVSERHHNTRSRAAGPQMSDGAGHNSEPDKDMAVNGSYTEVYAMGCGYPADNRSEEGILGASMHSQQRPSDDISLEKGIVVTEEYQVTSTTARPQND
ncbi:hypothetical protein FDECE_10715 [Fusarium decemcellulare]|nr:hypothetical protein FDECE_10715 [Fusarium decemcellulare]